VSVRAATWLAIALGTVTVGGAVTVWALLDLGDPDVQPAVGWWSLALGVLCVMASYQVGRSTDDTRPGRHAARVPRRALHTPPRGRPHAD
jgi:asparagine N-glycosylation enzyme membrane subunit Stt3